MKTIERRIAALEQVQATGDLPADVRHWLGETLTDQERAERWRCRRSDQPAIPTITRAELERHDPESAAWFATRCEIVET